MKTFLLQTTFAAIVLLFLLCLIDISTFFSIFSDCYYDLNELMENIENNIGRILDMIATLRNIQIVPTFENTSKLLDPFVQNNLPNALTEDFAPIYTTGNGDCFYNSISIGLIGTEHLNIALRLVSLFVILKYREQFSRIFNMDVTNNERNLSFECFLLGVGTPFDLIPDATEIYGDMIHYERFSWANENSLASTAIALKRPILIYSSNLTEWDPIAGNFRTLNKNISRQTLNGLYISFLLLKS